MTRFQLVKLDTPAVRDEKFFGLDGDPQPAAAGHRLVVLQNCATQSLLRPQNIYVDGGGHPIQLSRRVGRVLIPRYKSAEARGVPPAPIDPQN